MRNARNQHRTDYAKELIKIVQTTKDKEELKKKIAAYHERDIANAIVESDKTVRKCIYDILDIADIAEIFAYIEEEPGKYLEEMPLDMAAKVVSNMDSDDAMDLFEELSEEDKYKLLKRLDKDAKEDVQK
ncbi:MAG: magnesium transporter MgtE N-terminal domain-containing protein, partial [Anaerostipes hadrus]